MASDGSEDIHGVRGSGKDQAKSLLGNCLDPMELFSLLETRDGRILDEVKSLIHENLHATRESWFLYTLVDYYLATKSSRGLDVLTGIREPHDKHLFDKVLECLKSSQWREGALFLLSHIVCKQPSWLHHIATHKVLTYLLQLLKTDTNIPHLMSGILTVVTLLPIIPSLAGPHLHDIFEVFARLAAWNTNKKGNVPDVYFLHLRVALYHLFCRVYAMYPCNFLAFLRSHYGGRESNRENRENPLVFSETIRPMLERVRLHPLLVTASKETELCIARWKNLEPHDIIVQCSEVSLDNVESGHHEEEQGQTGPAPRQTEPVNIVRQWSLSESVKVSLPVEPGSLVADALDYLTLTPTACPLQICDFSPTSEIHDQQDEHQEGQNSLVTSMASVTSKADYEVDFELPDTKVQHDEIDGITMSTSKGPTDMNKMESSNGISRSSEGDVVTAEEAKEESQKLELSGSLSSKFDQQGQEQDPTGGHFVSTTDNLTATVAFDMNEGAGNSSLSSSSMQEEELGMPLASLGGASNVLLERLVHGINRLRFFSHCGHPPEIPLDWLRRSPTLRKSHSWPVLKTDSFSISPHETTHPVGSPVSISTTINKPSSNHETGVTNQVQDSFSTLSTKQEELPDKAVLSVSSSSAKEPSPPVPGLQSSLDPQSVEPTKALVTHKFAYPSPTELLDTYLHLGSQVYLQGLSLTSGKDTNWTHFGGPPPVDEMTILRGEITLLHTQLLFERYRREVHAVRNRRLLGKAKKARALEEQNSAMKDQLVLQEKEIHELNQRLRLSEVKVQTESPASSRHKDLHDHLRLLQQDNEKLDATRQRMEFSLEHQQKEIAQLRKTLDETQCELLESTQELESVRREASRCSRLQREVKHLTAKLAVASDLHQRYLDKIEHENKPTDLTFDISHLKESAEHEIEDLKRQCRNQTNEIEALKMRVEILEQGSASKDLIIEEQKQLLENVKSSHKDIVQAKEVRIQSLLHIIQRQEEHILELSSKLCIQDSVSKPVPSSFHKMEAMRVSEWPWHPAQTEPTTGIHVEHLESDYHHSTHSTNQDSGPNAASLNLP